MLTLLQSLHDKYPVCVNLWISVGFLVGFWMILDALTNTDADRCNTIGKRIAFWIAITFFFVVDVFLWPLYLLSKLEEAFWNIRR